MKRKIAILAGLLLCGMALPAQVYSPKLLAQDQPDSTNLKSFAEAICRNAKAHTPREKAEAIWRFFLTDGRFVKPGFWYHIAGWTYEEPTGEVLDPIKLINSYGFGLCYHIAPLLEAVFEGAGFADARTWFLTGHTVAEVFYDGHYHYFDSDMMGYNVAGEGHFFGKPVVGVRELERDSSIILGKLREADRVKPESVDEPWYPADVRAKAMGGLADLFKTTEDNYLYADNRYAPGHSMDFALRPGEKLIRFFQPEEPGLFYLPYHYDGKAWKEFPQEIAEYSIRTPDGPRSQKDGRVWGTGRIEYSPTSLPFDDEIVVEMPSPYVIIDAKFSMNVQLKSVDASLHLSTSTDGGANWNEAGDLVGPYSGVWTVEPKVLVTSAHGRLTAVSGTYGYLVRIKRAGDHSIVINSPHFVSRVQLNPRTLPSLNTGQNVFHYTAEPAVRRVSVPAPLNGATARGMRLVTEKGQSFLTPSLESKSPDSKGEIVYSLDAGGDSLTGFEVGARFLNLRGGLAPDKLTAETRPTAVTTNEGDSAIAWSISPEGPFTPVYQSSAELKWLDGDPIDRLLMWPEVFRRVSSLPAGTKRVYVKISSAGPAIDSIRLAAYAEAPRSTGKLVISQVWREGKQRREHVEAVSQGERAHTFQVHAGSDLKNESVTFLCQPETP